MKTDRETRVFGRGMEVSELHSLPQQPVPCHASSMASMQTEVITHAFQRRRLLKTLTDQDVCFPGVFCLNS